MGDYNLTGLNPRDFEHLTQALAMKTIAPGVVPFGDGPDGGREATYRGKMNYPSLSDPWNGYLIIQSKFRARPSGDVKKDGEWVLNQLEADLIKFTDTKRNLPKPEYYLLVTNLVLTPAQARGSKDKVFDLLEKYKPIVSLKGYDVWDYDKLSRLLDGQPEISARYAGHITSGDVLSKMIDIFSHLQPDFLLVMSRFLQNELRADQFVKLEQAGQTADQKTALAQVFVDLPASNKPISVPLHERSVENLQPGIVAEILEAGSEVLKRSTQATSDPVSSDVKNKQKPGKGRFVIVGGPGQGKSTVGQFLCQVYRAAILNDRPTHMVSDEARDVINLIELQCRAEGAELPVVRRFPIRVVLDQFATAVAKGEARSLLSFILKRIMWRTDSELAADDLRHWLASYPWLIVLDGLDEVPATSNRSQVLDHISEFWTEVATLDADVLVVATTRPQGYNDDFSPSFYLHRYLAPLSRALALRYGDRLTTARYGTDPDRKLRVLGRLTTALDQDTTARLMRTPLQVTIMATLVDRIGQPPHERWRLFQQYYEVIYQRETEREIPASRILQQRRADVDAIHNRVGLLLQTESEQPGTTESRLPIIRFNQLVRDRIAEEGYEGDQLIARTDEITEAALLRLVFLVGLDQNHIGFEVRSLQEFTAAEALMDGRDEQVRARLEAIAPSSHWRNVFLFAAGQCFAERQFLRDMVITICDQLNDQENDKLFGVMLAGSRLALDILNDGVAREQPNYARSLARLALRLMELPDEEVNIRLSTAHDSQLDNLFQEYLSQHLERGVRQSVGAWALLRSLITKGVWWAVVLAEEKWPDETERQYQILKHSSHTTHNQWSIDKLAELIPSIKPWKLDEFDLYNLLPSNITQPSWFPALEFVQIQSGERDCTFKFFPAVDPNMYLELSVVSVLDTSLTLLKDMKYVEAAWAPYISAARFAEHPTQLTLAHELRWLSEVWDPATDEFHLYKNIWPGARYNFAWPLFTCVFTSKSKEDLLSLAERARQGDLGDRETWLDAETRWKEQGITGHDLRYMTDEHWPFDSHINEVGCPLVTVNTNDEMGESIKLWNAILALHDSLPHGKSKETLADLSFDALKPRTLNANREITPLRLRELIIEDIWSAHAYELLEMVVFPDVLDKEWIDFFEWFGTRPNFEFVGTTRWPQTAQLAKAYVDKPERYGLINVIGTLVLAGNVCPVPDDLLTPDRFNTHTLRSRGLLIQLSQSGKSKEEIERLAEAFVNFPTEWEMIRKAVHLLNHSPMASSDKEVITLALWDKLPTSRSSDKALTVELLYDLMRSRASKIQERGRWKNEYKLPSLP